MVALHLMLIFLTSGRKSYLCVISFLSHQLSTVSCRSCKLCTFTRFQLNVVDNSTNRDICDRKCVSNNDICVRSRYNLLTNN